MLNNDTLFAVCLFPVPNGRLSVRKMKNAGLGLVGNESRH